MIVTSDHGQQPDAVETRGWPIFMTELMSDLADHLEQGGWQVTRTSAFVPGDSAVLTALRSWQRKQADYERQFYSTRLPVR